MQALTLPAAHGWLWLTDGFRVFRKNPVMLTFLVISYWLLMALVNHLIPWVGSLITTMCIPAFSVSLMTACRTIDLGLPVGPPILFSGFFTNLRALLTLGAIYLVATLAILGMASLADDGALMLMMLAGSKPSEESLGSGELFVASQVALVLLCPLIMAYWYAPMLAGWHGFSPGKALFFSFFACVRNWRAFLVYSLAVLLFTALLPTVVLALFAALLPEGAALLTGLLLALIVLVLLPTLFASFYSSYRSVFVSIDDDA